MGNITRIAQIELLVYYCFFEDVVEYTVCRHKRNDLSHDMRTARQSQIQYDLVLLIQKIVSRSDPYPEQVIDLAIKQPSCFAQG